MPFSLHCTQFTSALVNNVPECDWTASGNGAYWITQNVLFCGSWMKTETVDKKDLSSLSALDLSVDDQEMSA